LNRGHKQNLSLFVSLLAIAILFENCGRLDNSGAPSQDSASNNATPGTYSLLTSVAPEYLNHNDGTNYELGMAFTSSAAGSVAAIKFYKSTLDVGTHIGHLWNQAGTELTNVTFTGETASGWQTQMLATPYALTPNTQYVVTVNMCGDVFAWTDMGFATAIQVGPLTSIVGNNGLYGPMGAFPTLTYQSENYFRDVVFVTP